MGDRPDRQMLAAPALQPGVPLGHRDRRARPVPLAADDHHRLAVGTGGGAHRPRRRPDVVEAALRHPAGQSGRDRVRTLRHEPGEEQPAVEDRHVGRDHDVERPQLAVAGGADRARHPVVDADDAHALGDPRARGLGDGRQPEAVVASVQLAAAGDGDPRQHVGRRGEIADLGRGQPGAHRRRRLAAQLAGLDLVARVGVGGAVAPVAVDPLVTDQRANPPDRRLVGVRVLTRAPRPVLAVQLVVAQAVGGGDLAGRRSGHARAHAAGLEHEHAPPLAGEQQRGGQADHPGPDDHRVEHLAARCDGVERTWRGGIRGGVPERDRRRVGHRRVLDRADGRHRARAAPQRGREPDGTPRGPAATG